MKKIIAVLLCVVMAAALFTACAPAAEEAAPAAEEAAPAAEEPAPATEAPAPAEEPAPATEAPAPAEEPAEAPAEEPATEESVDTSAVQIGFYADAQDSYYSILNDALVGLLAADPDTAGWTVDFQMGDNTAAMQLSTVENFIASGYDAIIVIQNNPNTTSECITKCVDAGIPYFGAAHAFGDVANAADAAGSSAHDFFQCGVFAGEDAMARGVSKLVMIEGVLGQGSAGAQSLGFLQAYEDGGANMGGATAEQLATEKDAMEQDGSQEIEVVYWESGGWMTEPAHTAMANIITALGADGFDGVYVQNNPMAQGVFDAMTEAGLNPSDYWIGSSNGREISWEWAKEGTITMDVNQPSTLESGILYQQLKAYFAGEEYRKYIHPYLEAYNIDDIAEKEASLVPNTETQNFLDGYAAGAFITDINDPIFTDQPGYGQ